MAQSKSKTKSKQDEFIEDCLNECIKRYVYCLRKAGGKGLAKSGSEHLKSKFRPWFEKMMKKDAKEVWAKDGEWVLIQTCRMAGYTARKMVKDGRTIPTKEHLDHGIDSIKANTCTKKQMHSEEIVVFGGWCGT